MRTLRACCSIFLVFSISTISLAVDKSTVEKKLQQETAAALTSLVATLTAAPVSRDVSTAFQRYEDACLAVEIVSDDPLLYLPSLKISMQQLRQLRQKATLDYIEALEKHLDDHSVAISWSFDRNYVGVRTTHVLHLSSRLEVAQTIQRLLAENLTLKIAHKAELLHKMRQVTMEAAIAQAPALLLAWKNNKQQRCAESEKLCHYLFEEGIARQRLGIPAEDLVLLYDLYTH